MVQFAFEIQRGMTLETTHHLGGPGANVKRLYGEVLCDPTWIGIKRDLLDGALVPLNADLDQNNEPEVAQRGRNLDA
jgi:hypothetical protein